MKKFILLLSIVACFGIAKSQTVSLAAFYNGSEAFTKLNLTLPYEIPSSGAGKISQLLSNPLVTVIEITNNTENTMVAGDSIKIGMKYNGQPKISYPYVLKKDLKQDSSLQLMFDEYIIIGGLTIEGDNSICYSIVQYNETPVTTDEGSCVTLNIKVEIPTSISENTLESVKVYPNPVRNMLNIDNLSTEANISIYNMAGQLVISEQAVSGTNSIDLSSLSAGLYIVRMQDGNNVRTEKVQVIK